MRGTPSFLVRIALVLIGFAAVGLQPTARALADETPHVRLFPSSGPPGTVVFFEGDGFTDSSWQQANDPDAGYFDLDRLVGHCELLVHAVHGRAHVTSGGHLSGRFVVGSTGWCFQGGDQDPRATVPGRYDLELVCHVCTIGEFTVTSRPEERHSGGRQPRPSCRGHRRSGRRDAAP